MSDKFQQPIIEPYIPVEGGDIDLGVSPEYLVERFGLGKVSRVSTVNVTEEAVVDWNEVRENTVPVAEEDQAESDPDRGAEGIEPQVFERLFEGATSVTAVRDKVGMGKILESAQESIQAISNKRTHQLALVLSPAMLEKLFEEQYGQLKGEMSAMREELEAGLEQARIDEARAENLNLLQSFTPIKTDIKAPEVSQPSEEVEL